MFQTSPQPLCAAFRPVRTVLVLLASALALALALALAACGDSVRVGPDAPDEFTVAGVVSGLTTGQSVGLSFNGGDAITVDADGPFAFPDAVAWNGSYSVTVAAQPAGATCTVSNGAGAGVTADVSNVSVDCSAVVYSVSGDVAGLTVGAEFTLQNNGADDLVVFANGPFAFATPLAYDGSYAVTVLAQPAGATCTVSNGTGAGVTADVADVSVSCSADSYTVGGTVAGLGVGEQVTLFNNAADALTVTANGPFTFATPVAPQGTYNVTVGTQPVGQTCTVMNGQGTVSTGNVADVSVACSTNTFTIGGTLSGLAASAQVTLENNGADPLTLTSDGAFTFATPVVFGASYSVTVGTQPGNQSCVVTDGAGTNVSADVTDVDVACIDSSTSYTTPGSYTYTVPAGVTSIEVAVTGGGGGGGGLSGVMAGGAGGAGAVVVSQLSVTPGQALSLVVGGGGGDGADGPTAPGGGYTCGASGGGGGSSNVDAGTANQVIAGGGGGGGACGGTGDGGNGSASNTGAGGDGAANGPFEGGHGGDGGLGGAGGNGMITGQDGADGEGGAGGAGDDNSPAYPGGAAGSSAGAGTGGNASAGFGLAGAGGGGYGGGGAGSISSGGGAGGSTGPAGSTYAPGANGGASAAPGGDGSIVVTVLP